MSVDIELAVIGRLMQRASCPLVPSTGTEGIIETARELVKAAKRMATPSPDAVFQGPDGEGGGDFQTVRRDLTTAIEKYYVNPQWLKLRKWKAETVSGKGISSKMVLANKFREDPARALQESLDTEAALINKAKTAFSAYTKALHDIDANLGKSLSKSGVDTKASVEEAIKQLEALPNPMVKAGLVKKRYEFLGGTTLLGSEKGWSLGKFQLKEIEEIPALKMDEVKALGEQILRRLDYEPWTIVDMKSVNPEDGAGYRSKITESGLQDKYYSLCSGIGRPEHYMSGLYTPWLEQLSLLPPLEAWIRRSIEG